jgi:hypothetical protein
MHCWVSSTFPRRFCEGAGAICSVGGGLALGRRRVEKRAFGLQMDGRASRSSLGQQKSGGVESSVGNCSFEISYNSKRLKTVLKRRSSGLFGKTQPPIHVLLS